jgi:magnesium transporter
MQNLTDGPVVWKRLGAAIWKEFLTASLIGLACGAVVGAVVIGWRGQMGVGMAIFSAITLSMIVACLFGVAVPTMLRAARADPKIAAGPVVLAAADVATLLIYFGLGLRFLGPA